MRFVSCTALSAALLAAACQGAPSGPASPEGHSALQPAQVFVEWKGYNWTVTPNASAAVDGDGNLVITRTGPDLPGGGGPGVQIPLFDPTINANGTPWMLFSYVDNGPAVSQGYDLFINYNSAAARISGGSLFSCDGLGWERYGVPAQEDFLFLVGCGARSADSHTLYVGERADGTVDAIFDGSLWKGTFLKDNAQAPFAYTQVYLRVRDTDGAIGDTYTFTDFRAGGNHPGGGNKDACKDGGWSESGLWNSQGQCNQYANTSDKKAQEISGS
jgi:hypothetical protein